MKDVKVSLSFPLLLYTQNMCSSSIRKKVRVGLALSGGGGRGLAQVGALKCLERAGIPVDVIAGTSIGPGLMQLSLRIVCWNLCAAGI